jgi:protocatechuate 3,4-dioxygenase beta subunit
LLDYDPIYESVTAAARQRMVSSFDLDTTTPEWALGYYFEIVIGGHLATPTEV